MPPFFPSSSELFFHKNDGPSARGGSAFGGLPPQGLQGREVKTHPSAIPAEAGIHGSSVPLSEAFLDSSSARDSIPEQYRVHFDELRSDILAFCKEFGIPISTLSNKEAFGGELTSKRIPPERMAQAVSLFARLEYLVTNKEPLREERPEYLKEAERLYHLTEQYTSQVSLLERVGILKDGVITGIDGKNYPIPTLEQIAQRLYEQQETLSTKRDQGFTKLLLVPFGMSLDTLRETLKQFLLSYKQSYPDFDLDINDPFYTWKEGYLGADTRNPPKIFYRATSFSPKNHHGRTKLEILEEQADNQEPSSHSSFPGWTIHLLQPSNLQDLEDDSILPKGIAFIPRVGQGHIHGKVIPRPSLEAGKSPIDYLSTFQKAKDNPSSLYFQESGFTPEDWILAFMTHLTETGKPLDDADNPTKTQSVAYLTGVFFPSIGGDVFVPYIYWNRGGHRVELERNEPRYRDSDIGIRSSVMI